MVRSMWLSASVLLLAVTPGIWGQSTYSPYGGGKTKTSSAAKGSLLIGRTIVVHEPGKGPQRCKIIGARPGPNGSVTYRVKSLKTGTTFTLTGGPEPVGAPVKKAADPVKKPVAPTAVKRTVAKPLPNQWSSASGSKQAPKTVTTTSKKNVWPSAHSTTEKRRLPLNHKPVVASPYGGAGSESQQLKPVPAYKPQVTTKPISAYKPHVVTKPVPTYKPDVVIDPVPAYKPLVTTVPIPSNPKPLTSTPVPCTTCENHTGTIVKAPAKPGLLKRIFKKGSAASTAVVGATGDIISTEPMPNTRAIGSRPMDWRKSWGNISPTSEPLVSKSRRPSRGTLLMQKIKQEQSRNDLSTAEAQRRDALMKRAAAARGTGSPQRYEVAKPMTEVSTPPGAWAPAKATTPAPVAQKKVGPVKQWLGNLRSKSSTTRRIAPPPTPTVKYPVATPLLPRSNKGKSDPLENPGIYSKDIKPLPPAPALKLPPPPMPGSISGLELPTAKAPKVKQAQSTTSEPLPPSVPTVTTQQGAPVQVPLGAGSVIASGSTNYIPVPIVNNPGPYRAPQMPRPPMPNQRMMNAYQQASQAGQMRGRNAFTVPGPSQRIPAENQASDQLVNAFGGSGSAPTMPMGNMPGGMPRGMMPPGMMPRGMMPQGMMNPMMARGMQMPQQGGYRIPPHVPIAGRPAMPPVSPMGGVSPQQAAMMQAAMMQQAMMQQAQAMQRQQQAAKLPAPVKAPLSHVDLPTESSVNATKLMGMLKNANYPSHREWAADQLSSLSTKSHPEMMPAILTAAQSDPAATVRAGCMRAIAKMGVSSPEVMKVAHQMKADKDPRVQEAAKMALTTLGATK